jgi:hypothetical protein
VDAGTAKPALEEGGVQSSAAEASGLQPEEQPSDSKGFTRIFAASHLHTSTVVGEAVAGERR